MDERTAEDGVEEEVFEGGPERASGLSGLCVGGVAVDVDTVASLEGEGHAAEEANGGGGAEECA